MKLIEILKILRDENIVIDFLGYKEGEKIINEILKNPDLIYKLEKIPDEFWEEAKQKGLLLYSDRHVKRTGKNIVNKYIDVEIEKERVHMPTLEYQKRMH